MKRKTLVLWTQAMVACAAVYIGQQSIQAQVASGGPGGNADWLPSNKTGIGTSYTTASNVWFTLQDGRLSELYYPDLSTTSVRNLDFVVTVGLLLEIKEVVQGASRPGQIPVGDKRRYNFVQIAGPLGKRPAKTGSGLALQKV